MHRHHGVQAGQVHTVLVAAGDVPGEQDVAVVVGGRPQPDAVAADVAVAHFEVVTFNKEAHIVLPAASFRSARQKTAYFPPCSTAAGATQAPPAKRCTSAP